MRIKKEDIRFGLPAKQARSLMIAICNSTRELAFDDMEQQIECITEYWNRSLRYHNEPEDKTPIDTVEALAEAKAEGFVELSPKHHDRFVPNWDTTVMGNALGCAKFNRPISREKAESLLAGVITRAQVFNDDHDAPHYIRTLTLFGSLADSSKSDFADIDLNIAFQRRPNTTTDDAYNYGRRHNPGGSFVDQLFFDRKHAIALLKNRSRYIQIQNMEDETFAAITGPKKIVFSDEM